MQVKAISAPVEALESRFGSSSRSMWLAGGEEVAAFTHRVDETGWAARPVGLSVWVAVPFERDVLLAAWMLEGLSGVSGVEALARMDDDMVRVFALTNLLYVGSTVPVPVGVAR